MQLSASCVEGVSYVIDLQDRRGLEFFFIVKHIDLDNVDSGLLPTVVRSKIVTCRLNGVTAFFVIHRAGGNTEVT